jgi:predicted dehydrogenase
VAVVGVGAFGRNHARVYRQLQQQTGKVRLVGVMDPDTARADAIAREFSCKAFGSIDQMLTTHSEITAASVVVPTVLHLEVARTLMESGVDVLIEKPVASTLAEADELLKLAKQHHLITKPMFFEVHRLSVFTPRSLDVDVVLDLMIHDLDVVLAFVNSPVKEIRAVGLPILSGKVDIANVRLEFESGCVANFTASRVSTERVRKLRFFQPGQYVSVDYERQDVLVFSVGATTGLPAQPSVNPQIQMSKPAVSEEEPLQAEIKAFLDSVRTRSQPLVSLEEGRRALELALAILAEIQRHAGRIGV